MNYLTFPKNFLFVFLALFSLHQAQAADVGDKGILAPVTLSVQQIGSGSVEVDPEGPYAPGTTVSISAFPDDGWYFAAWSGNVAQPTESSTTIVVEESTEIVCAFLPNDGQLGGEVYLLAAYGIGGGTVVRDPGGSGLYTPGTRVAITAVPDVPGTFTQWYGDVEDPNSPSTFVTMDATKVVVAVFFGDGFEGEGGEGEGEGGGCLEFCGDATADQDGDGLSDCLENCLETQVDDPDSDRDGMPDGWEFRNGTNLYADDSLLDLDGDGSTNIDEFLGGSDPGNALDPDRVAFVSTTGVDDIEGGSSTAPWRTISYALSRASVSNIRRIEVLGGRYTEDLTLVPGVKVVGPDPRTKHLAPKGATPAVIEGRITGAAGATLKNFTVETPAADAVLLTLNNVSMDVVNCIFVGDGNQEATGLLAMGTGPGGGIVDRCKFVGLRYGMDVADFHPAVRLSTFQDATGAHLRFRADGQTGGGSLGADSESDTGWNRFTPNQDAPSISNERPNPIKIERNDWDTDDPDEIQAAISGPMDFNPYLPAGSALLAASLFCSVFDADDQSPVTDAAVSLQPVVANPMTENTDGVYSFPALPGDMSYTVVVEAPGYQPLSMPIMLNAGDLRTVNFPMGREPVDPPPGGCQCADPGKAAPMQAYAGDLLVAVALLALLACAGRLRREESTGR